MPSRPRPSAARRPPREGVRSGAVILVAVLVGTALMPPAVTRAQVASECFDPNAPTPETFGPTDITAVTGNGGLSVALNQDATVTVLKWPSPSFYDQVKYRTTDRGERRMGALANEGAFLGIALKRPGEPWQFEWLRRWRSKQRFANPDTDEVVTTFRNRGAGVRVKVRDVVSAGSDVLVRAVTVVRMRSSKVRRARVIAFANFNPVFSKTPQAPYDDWCFEENNDDGARYLGRRDAVLHERSGVDSSTGEPSGAALVMAFDGRSDGHQIGADTYAGNASGESAYDDAADGKLSGNAVASGQTDAALVDQLALTKKRRATTTVLMAAAFSRSEAVSVLRAARSSSATAQRRAKVRWWRRWLRGTSLPRNAPGRVVWMAKRSLITIRQATDRRRSMIVASISTQPPYGLDWVRDGSFINRALDQARNPRQVGAHDVRYSELQATAASQPEGGQPIPPGNWAQNYYADGIVGGPIPYEIDETGLGIWTLWDHYVRTDDQDYLSRVYEAIQRAAHYLSDDPPLGCTDPATGLQCPAHEGDNEEQSQTLVGAQAVWLGLDSAAHAAHVRGTDIADANAMKWATRRDELGAAIDEHFFNEGCRCYTHDHEVGGTFLWPVGYLSYGSTRSDRQAAINWRHIRRVLNGTEERGRYEVKAILGNAHAWAGRRTKMRKVKRALEWMATVAATDTGLLGEAWMVFPPEGGKVTAMQAQPHATTHALFYLAALKAWGTTRYRP